MLPKELIVELIKVLFYSQVRSYSHSNIVGKIANLFCISERELDEYENLTEHLLNEIVAKAEIEETHYFRNGGDFEYNCQELSNRWSGELRCELYERFVESDVFLNEHTKHGGFVDCGGEGYDDRDDDRDDYSDMSYAEQVHADRYNYASQFSDPIQRAEIRAGA